MQHRSTPSKVSFESKASLGPSFETLYTLQILARSYKPQTLEEGRFYKHSLT